jgi:hypothetical protein
VNRPLEGYQPDGHDPIDPKRPPRGDNFKRRFDRLVFKGPEGEVPHAQYIDLTEPAQASQTPADGFKRRFDGVAAQDVNIAVRQEMRQIVARACNATLQPMDVVSTGELLDAAVRDLERLIADITYRHECGVDIGTDKLGEDK